MLQTKRIGKALLDLVVSMAIISIKDGFGCPLVMLYIPKVLVALHNGTGMGSTWDAALGLRGWELRWGAAVFLPFVGTWAYIKQYLSWGSRDLEWTMNPKSGQDRTPSAYWYYGGNVYNGDVNIEEAHVQLVNVTNEHGKIMFENMDAQLKGGETSIWPLHTGDNLRFDILRVPDGYGPAFEFLGFQNKVPVVENAAKGTYTATLRLMGRDFRFRDYKIRFSVDMNGGADAVKILESGY